MKFNSRKFLPLMVLPLMLVTSCSKTITPEEATKTANAMATKVASADFEFPTKCSTTSKVFSEGETLTSNTNFDLGNKFVYSKMSSGDTNVESWIYIKDNTLVTATSDGTNKAYAEVTTTVDATFSSDIESLVDSITGATATYLTTVSQLASSINLSVGAGVDVSDKFAYEFKSKGDGNLSANVTVKGTDSYTLNVSFDNYLLTKVEITDTVSLELNWGSCKLNYPDLSKFTKTSE